MKVFEGLEWFWYPFLVFGVWFLVFGVFLCKFLQSSTIFEGLELFLVPVVGFGCLVLSFGSVFAF